MCKKITTSSLLTKKHGWLSQKCIHIRTGKLIKLFLTFFFACILLLCFVLHSINNLIKILENV